VLNTTFLTNLPLTHVGLFSSMAASRALIFSTNLASSKETFPTPA
jgi:hypothetical protein